LRTVELVELFLEKDRSKHRHIAVNKALQKLRLQKPGAKPAAKPTYGRPPDVVNLLDPDAVAREGVKAASAAAAFDAVAETKPPPTPPPPPLPPADASPSQQPFTNEYDSALSYASCAVGLLRLPERMTSPGHTNTNVSSQRRVASTLAPTAAPR
jgi:hypothetical protein